MPDNEHLYSVWFYDRTGGGATPVPLATSMMRWQLSGARRVPSGGTVEMSQRDRESVSTTRVHSDLRCSMRYRAGRSSNQSSGLRRNREPDDDWRE